jgi:hypothetical protein
VGGEHGDALVQAGVTGRPADLVVDGELGDPGGVEQPTQHQDRLPVAAQRPSSGPGTPAAPFGVQQPGQEQYGVFADGQGGAVCDTHGDAGPVFEVFCERTTSYRGSASFRCTTTGPGVSALDHRDGYLTCSDRYSERLTDRDTKRVGKLTPCTVMPMRASVPWTWDIYIAV